MRRSRIVSVGVSLPGKRFFRNGSLDHAVRAGRAALEKSNYRAADVELFINAGVHRDGHYVEPAFACFIQKALGINIDFQARQTTAFDVLNGACGVLSALDAVDCLIQSGNAEVAMVVASEANADRRPVPEYVTPRSGAALLVDTAPEPGIGFRGFAFQNFPEHAHLYESVVDLSVARGKLSIRHAPEFEEAALASIAPVVANFLEREDLTPSEIDLVLPSQLSAAFVASLGDLTKIGQAKVVDLTGRFTDPHTTSPLLALDEAERQGWTKHGTRALFLTVGAGLTVGAALYEF